jgi:hypothetical protein
MDVEPAQETLFNEVYDTERAPAPQGARRDRGGAPQEDDPDQLIIGGEEDHRGRRRADPPATYEIERAPRC